MKCHRSFTWIVQTLLTAGVSSCNLDYQLLSPSDGPLAERPHVGLLPSFSFVALSEPIVLLGRIRSECEIVVDVRSTATLRVFLAESSGSVVDAAVLECTSGSLCPLSIRTKSFSADTDGNYFLYFHGAEDDVVEVRYRVRPNADRAPAPTFHVVLDRNGGDVALSNGTQFCNLEPLDLGLFDSDETMGIFKELEPIFIDAVVDRLRNLFTPYGVEIHAPAEDIPGDCHSTIYLTNTRGPVDDDPFETVFSNDPPGPRACRQNELNEEVFESCESCILYGLSGPSDLGNRLCNDDAIVFVGSLKGIRLDASVNDLANYIANNTAHEIAHLLGLTHVLRLSDIMRGQFTIGFVRDLTMERAQIVLEDQLVPFLYQDPPRYLHNTATRRR